MAHLITDNDLFLDKKIKLDNIDTLNTSNTQGEKISKNMYLYGTEEVPKIPQEIIDGRLDILNNNLRKLLNDSYLERDRVRVNKILKAIEFWKKLNNE